MWIPWHLSLYNAQNCFRNCSYGTSWLDCIIYPILQRRETESERIQATCQKSWNISGLEFWPSGKRHFSQKTSQSYPWDYRTRLSRWCFRKKSRAFTSRLFVFPYSQFHARVGLYVSFLEKRKRKSTQILVASLSEMQWWCLLCLKFRAGGVMKNSEYKLSSSWYLKIMWWNYWLGSIWWTRSTQKQKWALMSPPASEDEVGRQVAGGRVQAQERGIHDSSHPHNGVGSGPLSKEVVGSQGCAIYPKQSGKTQGHHQWVLAGKSTKT